VYISKYAQEKLKVSNLGWKSVEQEGDYLNYAIRLKRSAGRFEEGTLNILGIQGLKASLEMILEVGITIIERRILDLCDQIIRGLTRKGYEIKSPLQYEERSGIISFYCKHFSVQDIFEGLVGAGVVCAQRDEAIRVSPHFYNNERDVEGFFQALK